MSETAIVVTALFDQLNPVWRKVLPNAKAHLAALDKFLAQQEGTVYPAREHLFAALDAVLPNDVRVVILGQDPYPNVGQAHGLSFSVPYGHAIPKSLKNIYKELVSDVGFAPPQHGNLNHWVMQGVLLLNTVLTVQAQNAGSHRGLGWEEFTDDIIRALDAQPNCIVFMLWGRDAQSKQSLITADHHTVLCAAHPSPLSAHRGFLGCRHFSESNRVLQAAGRLPIDWQLPQ